MKKEKGQYNTVLGNKGRIDRKRGTRKWIRKEMEMKGGRQMIKKRKKKE